MSKIEEIRGKYPQIILLNQLELQDLKKDMAQFRKQDLKNLDDHKMFLEILKEYRDVVAGFGNLNGENYQATINNILSVGDDGIYSKKSRFIYELIQNVDDCDYTKPEDAELDVHFDVNAGTIVLTYNETGFTPFNVFAITGIAEAAKNTSADKIEIGEKGIGFKSVFGVAEKVLIQSGYFSFYLTKEEYTVPQLYYPEDFCHVQGTRLTLYVGNATANQIYDDLMKSYYDKNILLNQNPLLFLNKLTDLCFYIDKSFHYIKFHVDRHKQENAGMGLLVEENVRLFFECCDRHINHHEPLSREMQCIRYTKPIAYTREMFRSRYTKEAEHDKTMYLSILFPDVDYACAAKEGRLYSFLPTEISLNIPVVCHIPFKLDASRESVDSQGENSWFMHSISEFSKMLKAAYQDLAKRLKENVIAFLPEKNNYVFETEKLSCLRKDELKGETFLKLPIFYTTQDHLKGIDEIVRFSPDEEINEPQKIHHLLGESKELFILPMELKHRNYGITRITGVSQRLFRRAMQCPELTEEILQVLSGIKNVRYDELIKRMEKTEQNSAQICAILKYEKFCRAFNSVGKEKIVTAQQLTNHISLPISEMVDVRSVFDETIEADDFGENAAKYLRRINFRCIQLDDIRDKDFLICENVLVLSKSIESLKEFCRRLDNDDLLAARLQFRTASKKLDKVDDAMLPSEYLKLLKQIRKNSIDGNIQRRFIELINDSGMNEKHFINELLQNADDAIYPEDTDPEFKLTIRGTELKTSYNEKGFTKLDVRSITAIGESTKKSLLSENGVKSTGEKGIGFKSVFKIADRVEIRSGEFGFALTAEQPTIPRILEDFTPVESGTEMTFHLKSAIGEHDFSKNEVLRLCLCLKKLKRIHFGKFDVTIEDDGENRNIKINKETFRFAKIVYPFKPDEKALLERRRVNKNISEEQRINVYVPKSKVLDTYPVYTVLPTKVECNVPLVIDAPFMLNTSREQIVESEWNKNIKREISKSILRVIGVLAKNEGIKVLRFLKVKQESKTYSLDLFSDRYLNGMSLIDDLKRLCFLPTYESNCYRIPSMVQKVPTVIRFLLEQNAGTDLLRAKCLKSKSDDYNVQLGALQVQNMPESEVVQIISENYERHLTEEKFCKLLYVYLIESAEKLRYNSDRIRSLRIVPVKGRKVEGTQYVAYSGKIYFNDDAKASPGNCWLLDTALMPVEQFDKIFGVRIKEYDKLIEIEDYKTELKHILNGSKGWTDGRIYDYFLKEHRENYSFLSKCSDMLKASLSSIPLKNEFGELSRGKIYVSDMPAGYYNGQLLPKHIAHSECRDLARFLGCKNIKEVNRHELSIQSQLSEDDIEDLEDESLIYGYEIIGYCQRIGMIPKELTSEYNLGAFVSSTLEYDESILNVPLTAQTISKIRWQLRGSELPIVSRKVEKQEQFVIYKDGSEGPLNNQKRREAAIHRYSYGPNHCVCQMCLEAKKNELIEVNNIQKNPKYYWIECGLSLCLNCSKQFELLRDKKTVYQRFLEGIKNADVYVDKPIKIHIANEEITFNQIHLTEIQAILKYEEELNRNS